MIIINCEKDIDYRNHDSVGNSLRKGISGETRRAFLDLIEDPCNKDITLTDYREQKDLDGWLGYLRALGFRIQIIEAPKIPKIDLDKFSKEELMELVKEILNRL